MSWPENLPQYKNLASTPNTLNNGGFSWLLLTRMLSHASDLVSCRSTVRWVGPAEPTVRRYPDQSSNELHPPFLTSISCRDAFCARSMSACQVFNIFYIDDTKSDKKLYPATTQFLLLVRCYKNPKHTVFIQTQSRPIGPPGLLSFIFTINE